MSDHDFEKQVQQRLEQLKLRPSNAVWAEVERNIRLQKRRRRILIWLPAALLVMIAGGYLALQQMNHQDAQGVHHEAQATVQPAPQTSTTVSPNQTPSTDNSTPIQESNEPASQPEANQQADPVTGQPATTPAADQPVAKAGTTAERHKGQATITQKPSQYAPDLSNVRGGQKKYRPGRRSNGAVDLAARKPNAASTRPALDVPAPVTIPVGDEQPAVKDSVKTGVPNDESDLASIQVADSVQLDSLQTVAAKPADKTKTADKAPVAKAAADKAAQVKKTSGKESKWQFGVNAEGGFSGISSDGLFGFLEQQAPMADLAAYAAPSNSQNNVSFAPQFPRPPTKPSSLSMGPAFSIGGFAQRKLSNRVSLSAGVQYTYLSARQVVGKKVNNNRTVNRAPATSQVVDYYYDANNTEDYTNKYHFLEVPVNLHVQLNEGKRLPIGVDAGISASRLLSTSALHYDGIGGVYYKDDALFNKTQWAASAGFYLKLFSQTSHPLSVGPVLRYNMTPLLVKEFSTGQHLWSLGLRASVLLKK